LNVAYIDPKALAAAGFTDEIKPRDRSAVVQVSGLEGTGKTSWALTAPKPLFYQGTDFGADGVIQKATGQILRPIDKDGKPREYKLEIPHAYRAFVEKKETTDERRQREGLLANHVHEHFYKPFYNDYVAAIKAGVRSVVWDTALEVWENTRLSVYGREATNRDDLKAEANAKFREMVRLANVHGIVLIMINHLKPKWESYYGPNGEVKWRITTEYEMQGFDKAPFLVTASLWTKMTPAAQGVEDRTPTFEMLVKKCRDRVEYVGETFPALPFEELMGVLIPDVEDWG
jgi:hypothetical protein